MSSCSFDPSGKCVLLGLTSQEERTSFLDALPTNGTTEYLHIGYPDYNENDARKLAAALRVNTTLTSLSLLMADPGEHGTSSVVDALAINSTLISLDASYLYSITAPVAQKIATMLEVNSTLQKLALWNCRIEDQSAAVLTKALRTNSTLTSLNLSRNRISADGALEMSKVLSSNTTLGEISFDHNPSIGDRGISAIIDALLLNSSLTTLDIRHTEMTADSVPKIMELITSTSSLQTFDIRSNPLVITSLDKIRDALLSNGTISSLHTIPPEQSEITDESRAVDNVCVRNGHNLGQKRVSLYGLLYDYIINVAPEERFPTPPQKDPEINQDNPHRSTFLHPSYFSSMA